MKTRISHALAFALLGLASVAPALADAPAPLDTTGYSSIFTTLTSDMSTVATGPVGIGAFAALTVGIIFRVVWRLYKKAGSAVG